MEDSTANQMCFSSEPFVFLALTVSIDPVTTFRVVFTRNSREAVGVIGKITTDDYVKCIRKDSSQIEPLHSEPVIPNGYLCGHKFFTDEILQKSLALAQSSKPEKSIYPCPYFGHLYQADSGYLMWPISRGNKLYISGMVPVGPYYLILTNKIQLVEVVVRGFNNNFLRCIRSRQLPKVPVSDPHSKLFVPPPKSGFLCGKTFFDNKVLQDNAEIAKTQAGKTFKGQFPKIYSGSPYNVKCLIWPIFKDGILYRRGTKGPYRFIFTLDYKVIGVATWAKGNLKACDKITIIANKKHDTSDYLCDKIRIVHQQLFLAAEEACKKMNASAKNHYPAMYKGSGFNSEGPFFTYPVLQNGVYRLSHVGADRVVINTNCEIVGALTTLITVIDGDPKNELTKRLVKCHRIDDGEVPTGFFGANAETVDGIDAVDVVDQIKNDDYAKCIRRESSHTKPSHSELENSNGYLCGHEFFTDEILRQSLALAQSSVSEKPNYPCPYFGRLYPENSGNLMWPILKGENLYRSGKAHIGPYYLILNRERQFVDVVVKSLTNNFLRCIRSGQPSKEQESEPQSKPTLSPLKSGFLCGKIFFDNNVLQKDAEIASSQAGNKFPGEYPKEYIGPPYNEKCLIWPIFKDGSLYRRGVKGPYRFVLTLDYKVIGVAVWTEGKLLACDEKTITTEKNHDTSDYQCNKQRFSHQQLVEAAEEACVRMKAPSRNLYPA
ncbi:hypothetical protein EPUL_004641, partial [Erysiphe pulchra]